MEKENRTKYGLFSAVCGLVVNVVLAAAKIAVGAISGSVSVLADGINNLSDGASAGVSFLGFKASARPADEKHPFGHARGEYIAGLVISVLILAVALELFISSIEKIIAKTGVDVSVLMLSILGASIAVKIGLAVFYSLAYKKLKSPAVKASIVDSINDVVVTSAVLAASLISKYTGTNLDGWAGVAVAVFVVITGIKALKDALSPILGEKAPEEFLERIKSKVLAYDGVLGVHEILAHNYGPNKYCVSLHVEVDGAKKMTTCHKLIDQIECDLAESENIQVIIHADVK